MQLIAIFKLLKIKMSLDISGTEKCKITFALRYKKNNLPYTM